MAGFSVVQSPPRWQDTGQGAASRIASWGAWTADPSPLTLSIQPNVEGSAATPTILVRDDYNYGVTPLGQGGCGDWAPILDGFSNGATSGGDNPIYSIGEIPATPGDFIDLFVVLWGF